MSATLPAPLRAISHTHGADAGTVPFDIAVLAHDERHLRRKLIALRYGGQVLVDLPSAVQFSHGDRLVLEDGRQVEIIAAEEELFEITAHNPVQHGELCWHIGNRHLAAQIEADRILILRDPVIGAMLEGLGAHVRQVSEPFHPARGAYQTRSHDHPHGHRHGHSHD